MAILLLGATSNTVDTNSIDIDVPPGTVEGALMVASLSSPGLFDSASGWSIVEEANGWSSRQLRVLRRFAGASEPASYTFTSTGRIAGGIASFSGVDPDGPIDDSAGFATGTSDTDLVAPTVTATRAGGMLIGTVGTPNATPVVTPPGSMVEDWDVATGVDNRVSNAFAHETLGAAGATGTRTFTAAASAGGWGTVAVVLKRRNRWHVGFVGSRS